MTLTEPSSGTAFLAPATISMAATASDSDGNVTRVDFYAGTTFLGSDTSSPYTFRWENVAPGNYSLNAVATDNREAQTQSQAVPITVVPGSTPFTGTAVNLPGIVQGENFDNGGAQVAYRDFTAGNSGGSYRATDVDIQGTSDTGGGYNVGWIVAGEWLVYSVNVSQAGGYRLDLRVSAKGPGGRLHVEFNGIDKTGPLSIPDTGAWQQWTTISVPVTLAAGAQRMRVVVDQASASGVVGNLNFVAVRER